MNASLTSVSVVTQSPPATNEALFAFAHVRVTAVCR